jgi:uncharacterized membrane protein YgaE (UPF0421/DUF939 family)
MKCDFVRDENNNIWLSQCKDIQVRRYQARSGCFAMTQQQTQEALKYHANKEDQKLQMELDEYKNSTKQETQMHLFEQRPEDPSAQVLKKMTNFYEQIKEDVDIYPKNVVDEEDFALQTLLENLKDNSNAHNFKEFLTAKNMFDRPTKWKQIARQVNQTGRSATRADTSLSVIPRDNLRAQTAQKRKTCHSTLLDTTKDSIARSDYGGSSTSNARLVSSLKGDLIRQNVVNR